MKSRKCIKNFLIITVCLIFFSAIHVSARDAQLLDVTVDEVKGKVEIMLPDSSEWVPAPAEGGSIFTEGVQFRTGPFSSISLVLADSSVVFIDSSTFMTVDKFFKSGGIVTTRLSLIIGSIVNTLNEGTSYKNDYKVATPSFTTSLNDNEIKKIVAGAMYGDTVREGFKRIEDEEGSVGQRTDIGVQRSPKGIAQQQQIQRESSIAAPSK